jgi:hypothetical protein
MGYFSTAGPMPANLSFGRDLTIRRKIENGRYYCAFGRSKASNQGTTSRSTRALLKPSKRRCTKPFMIAALKAHVAEDSELARNSILSIKPRICLSVPANQTTGRDGIEGRAEAAKGAIHEHTARLR